jgi:putative PIN family toxin of toxin-antitoxin system
MTATTRVVFDCNTFVQALAAPEGPAGQCVQLAIEGKVSLFISPSVLGELREVTSRPKVIAKLHLVTERMEDFFEALEIAATLLAGFPEVFLISEIRTMHITSISRLPPTPSSLCPVTKTCWT